MSQFYRDTAFGSIYKTVFAFAHAPREKHNVDAGQAHHMAESVVDQFVSKTGVAKL